MILFYLNNKSYHYSRIIRNLFRSYPDEKQIVATLRFDPNSRINSEADVIVFAGMLRGEGLIYQYCRDNSKNFIYLDHAYINRGYNPESLPNEWMRMTYNGFTWSSFLKENDDRWFRYFSNHTLNHWNEHRGTKILVLPPSEATKALFPQCEEWTNNVIREIASRTNVPIHIREKPYQPVADPITNQVIDKKKFHHDKTIEEEIMEAKLIVTFNSAVPVQGTIMGVPCFCSPHAAAYPMNINLDQIDNPPEPNRIDWLQQLVYHQYTSEEMQNGQVWTLLKKYMQ